ncbi:MAG: ribosome small subunit-dependent GTPase A [Blautia sp.]|nr:ribosome small subunit-dependent GTPase A [Blautia sp.]MCM1201579.1 ribosome small subunit-dependent GTPase A [Bacteroides fragilis]
MTGKIVKGIAGFYYVHIEDQGVYECKARGIFRNQHRKPLIGDNVSVVILDEQEKEGNITEILPRRNELLRPAVANIDQALVIFAIVKPNPDFKLLDRFLIRMEQQKLKSIICFNKQDIASEEEKEAVCRAYGMCGYRTLFISAHREEGLGELRELLAGRTTALAGPSGVGKSTLINALAPEAGMETGSISRKIERGRHTTRHSEIIALGGETYLMDTPGFTSLHISEIMKEELSGYYPEFGLYEPSCRFGGCAHISEPDCGVKMAVGQEKISRVRYENYKALYQELKEIRRY